MDYNKASLRLHKKHKGKLEIKSKVPLKTKDDLSIAYTPGVAEPCKLIAKKKSASFTHTMRGNTVAIVTDGSAVLGLGNIGPEAALPVMEGKAILFKEFADVDAFPICLATQDINEIIETVRFLAPTFGGINLEDIAAPKCFHIERDLQDLGIPVFHDDQHGTAIVLFAALLNACKVVKKKFTDLNVVINGAGSAGIAIAKILVGYHHKDQKKIVNDVVMLDSKSAIYPGRVEHMNQEKEIISSLTNKKKKTGSLKDVIKGADVFIGVSKGNVMTEAMVRSMNKDPIIFAMANPIPEIMPNLAKKAGAKVVGTGRSDFPNQINNVLAFPGIFRGALDCRAKKITEKMKLAAAKALANAVKNPTENNILPSPLDKSIAKKVAKAVMKAK